MGLFINALQQETEKVRGDLARYKNGIFDGFHKSQKKSFVWKFK